MKLGWLTYSEVVARDLQYGYANIFILAQELAGAGYGKQTKQLLPI